MLPMEGTNKGTKKKSIGRNVRQKTSQLTAGKAAPPCSYHLRDGKDEPSQKGKEHG